jgi:hypothetical protein
MGDGRQVTDFPPVDVTAQERHRLGRTIK